MGKTVGKAALAIFIHLHDGFSFWHLFSKEQLQKPACKVCEVFRACEEENKNYSLIYTISGYKTPQIPPGNEDVLKPECQRVAEEPGTVVLVLMWHRSHSMSQAWPGCPVSFHTSQALPSKFQVCQTQDAKATWKRHHSWSNRPGGSRFHHQHCHSETCHNNIRHLLSHSLRSNHQLWKKRHQVSLSGISHGTD